VRLNGFVNAAPDFADHPKVLNGASDLMVEILGNKGIHTRIAVGCASLPLNAAVEVDAIFAID
jgi:enamine deaminase RidA (YjgF/YER057c/UK114 family)